MHRTNPWLAGSLVGTPVHNNAGQLLGKIEELVVDPSTGNVTIAILSMGGLLGFGDRLVAIPWNALSVMPGRDYVLLDMDKNVLLRAPAFDRRQWPDVADASWRSQVYTYYGHPEPSVVQDRTVVVHRDYRMPRKEMSVAGAVLLILLLVGLLGFTYMVSTRGWEQTKAEFLNSMQGVTYAMKETSGDAALTAKVKTALSLNKNISASSINVDSADGIVTLRGEVNDEVSRSMAGMIAQNTPGVREVRNHLYVMSPATR